MISFFRWVMGSARAPGTSHFPHIIYDIWREIFFMYESYLLVRKQCRSWARLVGWKGGGVALEVNVSATKPIDNLIFNIDYGFHNFFISKNFIANFSNFFYCLIQRRMAPRLHQSTPVWWMHTRMWEDMSLFKLILNMELLKSTRFDIKWKALWMNGNAVAELFNELGSTILKPFRWVFSCVIITLTSDAFNKYVTYSWIFHIVSAAAESEQKQTSACNIYLEKCVEHVRLNIC